MRGGGGFGLVVGALAGASFRNTWAPLPFVRPARQRRVRVAPRFARRECGPCKPVGSVPGVPKVKHQPGLFPLYDMRMRAGLTQRQAGELCGSTNTTVGRAELGLCSERTRERLRLCLVKSLGES